MPTLWGKTYTRQELLRRIGGMHQLGNVEPFELSEGSERGVRGVRVRNAVGLEFDVINDRGMAIIGFWYQGVPLTFLSAVGTPHPAFTEHGGLGFLRTWPVGFLTPGGLTQIGSPHNDAGEELDLHGRLHGTPATNVAWGGEWRGDEYFLWLEGSLRETVVFGPNIVLRRRIRIALDKPVVWLEDTIRNEGFAPCPVMFLQHFNLGFPLLDHTTSLELPEHTTLPRNEDAVPGLASCLNYEEPRAGYVEQVFFHDLAEDKDGSVFVRLNNPAFAGGRGLAITWRYQKQAYPVLVQWKMMGEGMYVTGVEPSTNTLGGRADEREKGRLEYLQPGEERAYPIELGFELG